MLIAYILAQCPLSGQQVYPPPLPIFRSQIKIPSCFCLICSHYLPIRLYVFYIKLKTNKCLPKGGERHSLYGLGPSLIVPISSLVELKAYSDTLLLTYWDVQWSNIDILISGSKGFRGKREKELITVCYCGLKICVPLPKFSCWNPNTHCDGIRKWRLWKVIRTWRCHHERD